ncbi:cytochrome c [Congregibacter litoralis]|uniref:Cytochrome c, mono-and diheme variant n=1 Tax=Congregibacter litoralis KT71 TaxID=314285 RepID=A4A7Z8_9GAMM|nr:cytochrome c [Congregibacter litoralis]EAQ97793.1 Cytochrome c, mono- and diheme variant [Congregibacter litoralis KT71]
MSFLRAFAFFALTALLVTVVLVLKPGARETGSGPLAAETMSEAELVERGAYLALAGNCASCHTAAGGEYMAGGLAFETPFGTIYSTNITPDEATGIGAWSDWDLLNSMRHGMRANGDHLYPVFPYTAFTQVSNDDAAALYAYLQSIPAVARENTVNEVSFPFNQRPLMAIWKLLFFTPGAYEVDEGKSDEWNRGAYLVEALAHCSACHTPRNILGAEKASAHMAGGEYFDRVMPDVYKPWSAPNLTASSRGLGAWTTEDLSAYLQTARNDFLESFGPMNEVILHSTRHLTAEDVNAMAVYLKSLPGVEPSPVSEPDTVVMGRGRTIYNLHCGTCHLPTGEGDPEMAPRLNRGSLVVQAENPASMINAILYSPEAPRADLPEKWREPMEEFQYILDDEELAAVATFIRHSWDNRAGPVTPEQVARQRWE